MIKQAQHSLADLLHHDIIFDDKNMQSRISAGGLKCRIELRTDFRMFTASTSSQSKAALVVSAAMIENYRTEKAGCPGDPGTHMQRLAICRGFARNS